MKEKAKELLSTTELEDSSFELYSSYIGVFGVIKLTQSGTYYVYYNNDFKGFLKAKHTIFITQELNRLNKWDEFLDRFKNEKKQ